MLIFALLVNLYYYGSIIDQDKYCHDVIVPNGLNEDIYVYLFVEIFIL